MSHRCQFHLPNLRTSSISVLWSSSDASSFIDRARWRDQISANINCHLQTHYSLCHHFCFSILVVKVEIKQSVYGGDLYLCLNSSNGAGVAGDPRPEVSTLLGHWTSDGRSFHLTLVVDNNPGVVLQKIMNGQSWHKKKLFMHQKLNTAIHFQILDFFDLLTKKFEYDLAQALADVTWEIVLFQQLHILFQIYQSVYLYLVQKQIFRAKLWRLYVCGWILFDCRINAKLMKTTSLMTQT